MEISKADQIALDDALVAPTDRLKIGKCNLRLSSDVTSKEANSQVVYDVLKLTPFYKAFQVSADVPEIYMQEFWASAYIHNRSVRFKMNNKKHILNLDQFRDILQILSKSRNENFFEERDLLRRRFSTFLAKSGHSGEIRKITMAILCPSQLNPYGKCTITKKMIMHSSYWGDIIYQMRTKYKEGKCDVLSRFTNRVVTMVMLYPSIPRRNKVNWHYARDDPMFTTINVISRNERLSVDKIPPKTKGKVRRKADTEATTKQSLQQSPKRKEWKEIITTEALKRPPRKLMPASGADEELLSHQAKDEQQMIEKIDDDENAQDDEDDDKNNNDENSQDDDDEEQTESEDDPW
ncbi:hypothetical protein Tco_0676340 [Tanacetum coccineum]